MGCDESEKTLFSEVEDPRYYNLMVINYLITRMRNNPGVQGFGEAIRAFLSRCFRTFTVSTGHLADFKTNSRYIWSIL